MNLTTAVGNNVASAREAMFVQDAPITGVSRLIGFVLGINVNQANTDIAIPLILLPGANFIPIRYHVNNASISLTTATFGVYSAPAAGGNVIVTPLALSPLTTPTSNMAAATGQTFVLNQFTQQNVVYFRAVVAQGAAATVDFYLFGDVLP